MKNVDVLKGQQNKVQDKMDVSAFYDPKSNKAILDAYATGLELMKNSAAHPSMIFIAAHDNQVIEAFEVNVANNAVKHMNPSRFVISITRSEETEKEIETDTQLEGEGESESISNVTGNRGFKDFIFVRSKSVFTKIRISEISYIQACGDYVNIFVGEKRFTVHLTLRAIEERLPPEMFYRLHRSYLVSLDHIDNVEENTAYVGKHPIAISVQFKKELLSRLNVI